MTAQMGDIYRYEEEDYKLVCRTSRAFQPESFGFSPTRWKTSCMDGFWCRNRIANGKLFLQDLTTLDKNGAYPDINGVACEPLTDPTGAVMEDLRYEPAVFSFHYGGRPRHYHNIELFLPFTGRILAGTESVGGFYTHLGYQRPQSYKKLTEFVFENGVLTDVIDHSRAAGLLREGITKRRAEGTWNMFDEYSIYAQLPEEDREKLRWFIDRAVPEP